MRVRVKICGITRPEWARVAAEAGADAIGMVFAASPRRVTAQEARGIVRSLPPWVAPVGVFTDVSADEVLKLAAEVGFTTAQLHGDEPPETVAALGALKVIKAFRIGSEGDVEAARQWRIACERLGRWPDAYLLDARVPEGPRGGTGRPVDWDLAARMVSEFHPLILAGGLGPENVAEAIRRVRPWGVDASSSLETIPRVKDPERVRAFVAAVRAADEN